MPIKMQNLSTLEGISLMHGTVPVYLFREWSYNATVKFIKLGLHEGGLGLGFIDAHFIYLM